MGYLGVGVPRRMGMLPPPRGACGCGSLRGDAYRGGPPRATRSRRSDGGAVARTTTTRTATGARRGAVRALGALGVLGALLVVGGGCGGSSGGSATPSADASSTTATFAPVDAPLTPGAAVSVSAIDNLFRPEVVKVRAGTKLTFSNDGRNDHNVLPVRLPEGAKPFRVEAARFKPGDVYEVTLDRPGTYRYYCSIHGTTRRGMIGAVIVVP